MAEKKEQSVKSNESIISKGIQKLNKSKLLTQVKKMGNNLDKNSEQTVRGLDCKDYTMESIFMGKFDENTIEYMAKAKTKDLLLPFQDKSTWKLLNETLTKPQPETDQTSESYSKFEKEILYLQGLFQSLGGHKGNKFCQYLHDIRVYGGTTGAAASMDISKIGTKCTLDKKQNAEQLYSTFFNQTLPFMKQLILSMPSIFKVGSKEKEEDEEEEKEKENENEDAMNDVVDDPQDNDQKMSDQQLSENKNNDNEDASVELNIVGTPGKMEMWIRYFDYVRSKGMDSKWFNDEMVTVWRRCLSTEQCALLEHDKLRKNKTPLTEFTVFENGKIEDQPGQIHADFANQYIGGGVLEGGNVQEEIRFTVNTECVISKLLCPLPLRINEAILIFGSQQLFDYKGYGSRFSFDGYRNVENEMFFCKQRPSRLGSSVIAGIDAVHFNQPRNQIRTDYMMREIVKSYIGFSVENEEIGHEMDTVSTGNWGCGIFRGDPQLKALLQWISCTLSGRKVAYYTFGDRNVANGILKEFIERIVARRRKLTVGALWSMLTDSKFQEAYSEGDQVVDLLK